MQPSSLIFVLVVAIWAVYLLQHWIKRRDHLATVQSVDRFSASMRVLDDHRLHRETAQPAPRSSTAAPTRAARPEPTAEHAEAPEGARPVAPAVGAPRRVRGLTFLTALVLVPVVTLVAAFGPLSWWVAAAWLVGTIAAFGWLRQAVQVEREARTRGLARRRRAAQAPTPRAERRPQAPAARREEKAEVTAEAAQAPPGDRPAPQPRRSEVFDVVRETPEPVVPEPVAPAPGTWQPTPVPRPTYTMKAKAQPAAVTTPSLLAPLAQETPATDVPQVIDVEDEELPAIAGWA